MESFWKFKKIKSVKIKPFFNLKSYPKRTKAEVKLIDRNPFGDKDKDRVPNWFDCKPLNRKKQGKRLITAYHGTINLNLPLIKKHGLKASFQSEGNPSDDIIGDTSYITPDVLQAKDYAKSRTRGYITEVKGAVKINKQDSIYKYNPEFRETVDKLEKTIKRAKPAIVKVKIPVFLLSDEKHQDIWQSAGSDKDAFGRRRIIIRQNERKTAMKVKRNPNLSQSLIIGGYGYEVKGGVPKEFLAENYPQRPKPAILKHQLPIQKTFYLKDIVKNPPSVRIDDIKKFIKKKIESGEDIVLYRGYRTAHTKEEMKKMFNDDDIEATSSPRRGYFWTPQLDEAHGYSEGDALYHKEREVVATVIPNKKLKSIIYLKQEVPLSSLKNIATLKQNLVPSEGYEFLIPPKLLGPTKKIPYQTFKDRGLSYDDSEYTGDDEYEYGPLSEDEYDKLPRSERILADYKAQDWIEAPMKEIREKDVKEGDISTNLIRYGNVAEEENTTSAQKIINEISQEENNEE